VTTTHQTPEEMEAGLGEKLKALRLSRNLDQKTVAERAGVSVRALRSLEAGQGSTIRTLVCVLRALGRQTWLDTIAPVASINPLTLTLEAQPRQRASRPRRTGSGT
jgi:transcriptional regulator with XRE-family HTH domain